MVDIPRLLWLARGEARRWWPVDPTEAESAAHLAVAEVVARGTGPASYEAATIVRTRQRVIDAQRERFGRTFRGAGVEVEAGDLLGVDSGPWEPVEPSFEDDLADRIDAERRVEELRARLAAHHDERLVTFVELRGQGWTLAAIGEAFGVTESRACQLAATVRRLAEGV